MIPLAERAAIFAICAAGFAFRAVLSSEIEGEYADGVLVLAMLRDAGHWAPHPPLPSLLVELFAPIVGGAQPAGRFVTALAGAATALPLFALVRRAGGSEPAFVAAALWQVAPVAVFWHVRVDAQAIHVFFVAATADACARAWTTGAARAVHAAQALAAIAGACRWEGVAWIVPALLVHASWRRRGWAPRGWRAFRPLLWHLVWLWAPILWALHPDPRYVGRWEDLLQEHPDGALFAWPAAHFVAYLRDIPAFVTPPVALAACLGLFHLVAESWRRRMEGPSGASALLAVACYAFGLYLSHALYPAYRSSYAQGALPFVLGAAALAGHWLAAMGRRSASHGWRQWPLVARGAALILVALCLAWSLTFTLLLLQYQGDARADVRRVGKWLRTVPGEVRIVSDEIPQTRFWSGREVIPIRGASLSAGDLLVLHSHRTNLRGAYDALLPEWEWETLAFAESRLVLLLPDASPNRPGLHPRDWRELRYQGVSCQAVAMRLLGRRPVPETELR